MKRTNQVIAAVIIFLLPAVVWPGTYSGGDGVTTPYQISTPADWLELIDSPNDYDCNFVLVNDLDLQSVALTPVAADIEQDNQCEFDGTPFTGNFDGNGHVIRNAVINQRRNGYVGFFGIVAWPGEICNLGVEDANITGESFVAGLVGKNEGKVLNCYSNCKIVGERFVGGLVGENTAQGGIFDCYSNSSIIAKRCSANYIGGLVGDNDGSISNCYSTGNVSTYRNFVGGLVGINSGSVSDCNSTVNVDGDDYVGGLVGYNDSNSVSNCYSTGSVSGHHIVGGLMGYNDSNNVLNCHATGNVNGGSTVGGLIGYNDSNNISNCYSTGDVSGYDYIGGLVGDNDGIISNCHSTGNVSTYRNFVGGLVGENSGSVLNCYSTGDVNGDRYVGGLAGSNSEIVWNCYSTGDVNGVDYVGGLVGYSSRNGNVSNCYSAGDVNGVENVGGLVGYSSRNGNVSNCYATGDVNGDSTVGGLVGENRGGVLDYCYSAGDVNGDRYVGGLVGFNSSGIVSRCFWDTEIQTYGITESFGYEGGTITNVFGLMTAQMMTLNTYIYCGWDFITPIWTINEGLDYPRLWWEYVSPLELLDILYQYVIDLELHQGIKNSLLVKLYAALEKLEDDDEGNDISAINNLEAFINAVQAQYGKKVHPANADVLIDTAWQIIDLLSNKTGE